MAYQSPCTLHGGLLKKNPPLFPLSYRGYSHAVYLLHTFLQLKIRSVHVNGVIAAAGAWISVNPIHMYRTITEMQQITAAKHQLQGSHRIWGLQRAPPTSVNAVITTEGGIASFRICVSLYGYCCNYPSSRCPPLPSPHTRFLYINPVTSLISHQAPHGLDFQY